MKGMNHSGQTYGAAHGGRLIVGRYGPGLSDALRRLVEEAQREDALAPVTVVAPSRDAGLARRQEMGRKGFANVRFIVMSMLSELLGSAGLERQGRKPLTPAIERLYMRRTLSRASGRLEPVREHPNTLTGVRAAFAQLRRVDESMRARLAGRGGVTGEVARLYDDFRRITAAEWYDREDLAEAAAEAAERGDAPVLDDLGLIVFYLPRGASPGEERLMETLAAQGRCAVLLGTTGDDAADGETLELANRLRGTLETAQGEARADGAAADLAALLPGEAELHIAPNAHEELRWVIRRMVGEAEQKGVPLHRMAILYRMSNPYATLIRDELRMAGVPMAGPEWEPLANSAAGRTLRGLLTLAEGQFERSEVMEWLTGCPVRPGIGGSEDFSPSRWDSVTRQAGIVRGLEQWQERLGAYARRMDDGAKRRVHAGDISMAQAQGMREEADAARKTLRFIKRLAVNLQPPAEGCAWDEFGKWAGGLLKTYLDEGSLEGRDRLDKGDRRGNGAEYGALERIRQALDGFTAAEGAPTDSGLSVFRAMVDDLLESEYGHLGTTGEGVFVSDFATAAGMDFEAVWLVGMIEGGTPPAIRPDPLLNEPDWRAAGGHDRMQARAADERYEYLTAIAGAARRTLSYPVADASSRRQAYPSRWFLEQASALEGNRVDTGDLPKLWGREWLTVNESAEAGLSNSEDGCPADGHDYRLKRLLEWRQAGRRLVQHPFAGRKPLAGAVKLAESRGKPWLTEFDGNLSALAAGGRFGAGLRGAPVSATALETWAVCPYRYFLGHALGLRALNSPEETDEISALDRGSLVHEILERFMQESVAGGSLPAAGEARRTADRGRLMRIAEEEFAATAARGMAGKRLLWEMAKEEMRADLETFLDEDARLREEHGTGTVRVETGFGFDRNDGGVADGATGVRFRGIIDRIDVSADGSSALVIDYKTGSARPYQGMDEDVIDRGRRLQLGVYSLAARQLYPNVGNIAAAYWFITNRGGFKLAPVGRFDISDSATERRFREGVDRIVEGISAGVFPANPGPPDRGRPANCRFCEFDTLCPTGRSRLWNGKKSDPAVMGYLELSGEGGETQ